MSEPESESRMLTLSEVSQRTGISMPTLQRYKKIYQSRIPAEGKGRKQRYPESALPVFEELKVENAGRRGRPRKDGSPASSSGAVSGGGRRGRKAAAAAAPAKKTPARRGRPPGAAKAAKAAKKTAAPARGRGGRKAAGGRAQRGTGSGLLTLGQVSEQTNISYPTLVRYVRMHSDRLPSEGTGRSRRFHPEAVEVFRQLRQESGRGGRKPSAAKAAKATKAAGGRGRGRAAAAPRGRAAAAPSNEGILTQRLRSLEKTQQDLEKRFRGFVQSLQKLFK